MAKQKLSKRVNEWIIENGSDVFLSQDVVIGGLVAYGLFIWSYANPRIVPSPPILTTEAVIGGAVLAVTLTALAILVAFLGEEYIALLEKSVTVKKAILPYQMVAAVAGAQVLFSITGVVLSRALRDWGRDVIGSLATGLTICAIIGTVQIVNITARHGIRRARLPEIREAAKEAQRGMKAG